MDLGALSAISSSSSSAASSGNTIAGNFQTFLTLLTTQLQNQNPLEPLDTNQFTQQLVQFAGVEQTIQTNENLENLLSLTTASTLTNAVGFIGKTITAEGVSSQLANGSASWSYTVAEESPEASVTIRDENGTIVYTEEMELKAGTHALYWDGRRNDGTLAANGTYRIAIEAKDADGSALDVDTSVSGVVDGVDMTDSEPYLTVNGNRIKFAAVQTVQDTPL